MFELEEVCEKLSFSEALERFAPELLGSDTAPRAAGVPWEIAKRSLNEDISLARAWREHLELSQAEVAERLGVSQAAVSQLEAKPKLKKDARQKLAAVLGITPEQLNA